MHLPWSSITHFFSQDNYQKQYWLHQPSGCKEVSNTPLILALPPFTKHHDHDQRPKCTIYPPTFWICLTSNYSTNGQTWDIHRTPKLYLQNIPYFSCLHFLQGTPLGLSYQCIYIKLDPGTRFHLEFRLFNKVYCIKFALSLTIFDNTTSHIFGYPTISNFPPLQLIKSFIYFSYHYV